MVRAASRLPADHITVPGRNERRGFPLILHIPRHQAAERLDGARGDGGAEPRMADDVVPPDPLGRDARPGQDVLGTHVR